MSVGNLMCRQRWFNHYGEYFVFRDKTYFIYFYGSR